MRRLARPAAVALAAAVALTLSSPPAQAAVQRGVTGCFAWSWNDDWTLYASVYYHSRCTHPERIKIAWRSVAVSPTVATVPPDGKGEIDRMSDPAAIYDDGPA